MNSNYKNIIFDFGGVLIDIDYFRTIEQFKSLGIENFDELYSQAEQSNLFNDFETGKISSQLFINQLLHLIGGRVTPNQIVHAWNAMLLDIHEANIKLLEELKNDGKRLFLLSNTNEIHIPIAFNRWKKKGLIDPNILFEKIYLSHIVGLRKPNEDIFLHVKDSSRLNPSETLFIDDSIQHIETAKALGFQTHHLTNIDGLQSVLS